MGLYHVWYRTMDTDGLRGVLHGGLLGWIMFGIKQGAWRVMVRGYEEFCVEGYGAGESRGLE